jgi:hypothetical protein
MRTLGVKVFGRSPSALTTTIARPTRTTTPLALIDVAREPIPKPPERRRDTQRIAMVWIALDEVAGVRQGFGRFR